jgi:hypothetical protein
VRPAFWSAVGHEADDAALSQPFERDFGCLSPRNELEPEAVARLHYRLIEQWISCRLIDAIDRVALCSHTGRTQLPIPEMAAGQHDALPFAKGFEKTFAADFVMHTFDDVLALCMGEPERGHHLAAEVSVRGFRSRFDPALVSLGERQPQVLFYHAAPDLERTVAPVTETLAQRFRFFLRQFSGRRDHAGKRNVLRAILEGRFLSHGFSSRTPM